jgi:hypothetical protein
MAAISLTSEQEAARLLQNMQYTLGIGCTMLRTIGTLSNTITLKTERSLVMKSIKIMAHPTIMIFLIRVDLAIDTKEQEVVVLWATVQMIKIL